MSSSSRSIAAARQKRAGEQAPPMNSSRPVTSISSQGAFAQQQQYQQQQMMNQSIPVGSKNVRVAQNRSQTIGSGGRMNNQTNQTNQSQQDQSTKISVSNAIGLITLRLGRLENIVNDAIEDGALNNTNSIGIVDSNDNSAIPSNMKLVSDEVFENIVNRINLLESKVINFTNQNENFIKEMSDVKTSINNFNSILSSFINETNEKFIDYENALGEIEKNIEINDATNMVTSEQSDGFLPPHNESNESLASNETEENEETEQDDENN
jgi:hypothetical protein